MLCALPYLSVEGSCAWIGLATHGASTESPPSKGNIISKSELGQVLRRRRIAWIKTDCEEASHMTKSLLGFGEVIEVVATRAWRS
jgi:hypothetical protein